MVNLAIAQQSDVEIKKYLNNNSTSLRIQQIIITTTDSKGYCDVFTGTSRPFLVGDFRKQAFDCLHNLAHPGIKT